MKWSLDNLKDKQAWMRVGYTFLVLVVTSFLWDYILYALILVWFVQTLCLLFSGKVLEQAVNYMRLFCMSFYQYVEYLTYSNPERPYPLDKLP